MPFTDSIIASKFQYQVECKIEDYDLSGDLASFDVHRSIKSPYSIYILNFVLDATKAKFLANIVPGKEIKLNINLYHRVSQDSCNILKQWKFELIYIVDSTTLDLKSISANEPEQPDNQDSYNILAIPKTSYDAVMSPIRNDIYYNVSVQELIDEISTYDIDWKTPVNNKAKLMQYLAEKQAFIMEIKKINYFYGIFDGPLYLFFHELTNDWKIGAFNDLIKQNYDIEFENVAFPPQSGEGPKTYYETETFQPKSSDILKYFPISKIIGVQDNYSLLGSAEHYKYRVVNHPSDCLAYVKEFDLESMISELGSIDKIPDKRLHPQSEKKFKNLYDHIGFENQFHHFTTNISKKFTTLSTLSLSIDTATDLEGIYPGVICKLTSKYQKYIEKLMGKYIITQCQFMFRCNPGNKFWLNETKLVLNRTNFFYTN